MDFAFDKEFTDRINGYKLLAVEADVVSNPTTDELWAEIERFADSYRACHEISEVRLRPGIDATRRAYKALGKEPNRYRPSTEALCRRFVKGLELYRSLAIVDLVNLLSVYSGHSIGAFDVDKIIGPVLTLGVGREDEPYEAIGRGRLNIACLPVWRDLEGGIGTPTSDNERTKITASTKRLLLTINIYGDDVAIGEVEAMTRRLLTDYGGAENIMFKIVKP